LDRPAIRRGRMMGKFYYYKEIIMPPLPLMPKATAVWLVENTTLTFEQIGEFCGLHKLQIQAIADGEVAGGIIGMDPIMAGQLTADEIKRCEKDPRGRLKMVKSDLPQPVACTKGPRYTPVSKRADKPDGVAYLIKTYPELLDAQVARLLGTTKETIAKVRDRSHWNTINIKPRNPVLLGLCKQSDLDAALKRAQRRVAREQKAVAKEQGQQPVASQQHGEMAPAPESFVDPAKQEQPDIDPDDMSRGMG
jgi:uncharacterized protein